MKKYFIIFVLLFLNVCPVQADMLQTAQKILNEETPAADFSKLTPIKCVYTLYVCPVNSKLGFTIEDITRVYYIDTENKRVYTEYEEPINNVLQFDDNYIVFTTYSTEDKRTTTKQMKLNRYTGTVTVEGTVRHQYGAIANFTYDNQNFNGRGTCTVLSQGKKF